MNNAYCQRKRWECEKKEKLQGRWVGWAVKGRQAGTRGRGRSEIGGGGGGEEGEEREEERRRGGEGGGRINGCFLPETESPRGHAACAFAISHRRPCNILAPRRTLPRAARSCSEVLGVKEKA